MVEQVAAQHADGVSRAGGKRRVTADAVRRDAREALACCLYLDAVRGLESCGVSAHDGRGKARDGVRGAAALDGGDDGAGHAAGDGRGDERGAVQALLAAADRELGVWREEEVGLGIVGEVVLDVSHVRLLVGPEDHTQGVGQALARDLDALGKEAARVQRQHGRALVVDDAAAEQPAVAADHLVGVRVPARPLGHHVHVGDRGNLLVRGTGKVRIAEVAVAVVGLQAADVGDTQGLVERLARTRAPGGVLLGGTEVLDAPVAHEGLDVIEHLGPHALDELVDLCLEPGVVLGHGRSHQSDSLFFPCPMIRPIAPAPKLGYER